jgi:hypothetical protein
MTTVLASDPDPGVPYQSGSASQVIIYVRLGVSVFCEPCVRGLQGESRHGRPLHHQEGGRARADPPQVLICLAWCFSFL